MHPFLYFIYRLLRLVVKICNRVYFSKITVVNGGRGSFEGPCIIVSNHPATVLDPLNAAVQIRRVVFFLANASLFKLRFTDWLLNHLYCIPVERYQDTDGQPLNNKGNFERANEHLTTGGILYIAPEGSSYVERRLRKLKTGTARIALQTENDNHFQLGLSILPVGLNYSDPTTFRGQLLTIFGEPVRVADFQQDWENDKVEAVQKLTAHLADRLTGLMINTENDREDGLLKSMEAILQNENPLPSLAIFQRTKNLQLKLQAWKVGGPERYLAFENEVSSYFEKLKALKTSDRALCPVSKPAKPVLLFLALPLSLFGYLAHFLPCFFAKKLDDWLNGDIHWRPTYKYVAGIVTFPLFHGLQMWALGFLGIKWLGWIYLLLLVPGGLMAEWFLKNGKLLLEKWRARHFSKKQPEGWRNLLEKRQGIIAATPIEAGPNNSFH